MSHKIELTPTQKQTLYVLKALAMISAVAAHCVGYTAAGAQKLSAMVGTIGVPVFFVLSGFFFEEDSLGFWKKKGKTIVIPWLIWGAITYAGGCFANSAQVSILNGMRWILGCSTWLYFVPVLLGCFVLFRFCSGMWWNCVIIALWILSNGLTITEVLQGRGCFTIYQNLFNWVGFFSIGILLKRVDFKKVAAISNGLKWICLTLAISVGGVYLWWKEPSYWTPLSLLFELLCGVSLLYFSVALHKSRLLVEIGKNTYPIFFAHMQFGVSVTNRLLFDRLLPLAGAMEYMIVVLRPILVVLFTYELIILGRIVAKWAKLDNYLWLLGINKT